MSDDANSNNSNNTPRNPMDFLPKVATQIIISLHVGGKVTGQMPNDMKVMMYMIGEFLKQIGPALTFTPPSQIVKPPTGLVIPKN